MVDSSQRQTWLKLNLFEHIHPMLFNDQILISSNVDQKSKIKFSHIINLLFLKFHSKYVGVAQTVIKVKESQIKGFKMIFELFRKVATSPESTPDSMTSSTIVTFNTDGKKLTDHLLCNIEML
jgi:hypothetical protein